MHIANWAVLTFFLPYKKPCIAYQNNLKTTSYCIRLKSTVIEMKINFRDNANISYSTYPVKQLELSVKSDVAT
jgi:hypothetical protein